MTVKLLKITECEECFHCIDYTEFYECNLANRDMASSDNIPDWCPLENAKKVHANTKFTILDRLIKAIAIMDEKGRANQEYNSYMLWFEDWKTLRQNIHIALESFKTIEEDS